MRVRPRSPGDRAASSTRDLAARERDVVRTSPLVRVRGLLEKRAGEQRTLVAEAVEQLFPAEVLAMPRGKEFG